MKSVDWKKYAELWQSAQDDIERRILTLPLLVEIGADGWTVESYSQNEVMRIIQYSNGGKSKKKFREIVDRLKLNSVLKTLPDECPEGNGCPQKYWFSYVAGGSDTPLQDDSGGSQPDKPGVENPAGGGSQPASADLTGGSQPPSQLHDESKVGADDPHPETKLGSEPPQTGVENPRFARTRTNHDSHVDDKDNTVSLSENHQQNHESSAIDAESVKLLKSAGVQGNAHAKCLHVPLEHLKRIILNASAGEVLSGLSEDIYPGGVKNAPGFIVEICKSYDGSEPADNYLKALAVLPSEHLAPVITRLERSTYDMIYLRLRFPTASNLMESDPAVRRVKDYGEAWSIFDLVKRATHLLEIMNRADDKSHPAPQPSDTLTPQQIWDRVKARLSLSMLKGYTKDTKFLRVEGDTFIIQVPSLDAVETLQFTINHLNKVRGMLLDASGKPWDVRFVPAEVREGVQDGNP